MAGFVKNLKLREELEKACKGQESVVVLHFWAEWCEPCKVMDPVFTQLSVDTPQAQFFRVEAEEQPEISELYEVSAVPYFVFLKGGVVVDKLQGANAPELANKVAKWAGPNTSVTAAVPASLGFAAGPAVLEAVAGALAAIPAVPNGSVAKDTLPEVQKENLHELVNRKPVMLFMKGTPEEPRCGFSGKVVNALEQEGIEFGSFNILSDEIVRQNLKEFSNWPTFPQLYVKGELIGGCDIVLEMHQNGELKEVFAEKGLLPVTAAPNPEPAEAPLVSVADTPKGEPAVDATPPVPGLAVLKAKPEPAAAPPVSEPTVDKSMPTTSPALSTAPPNGVIENGSVPVKESETNTTPALMGEELKAKLSKLVNERPIMLFMKGSPTDPRCGFTRKVVQALGEEGLDYGSFNILSDENVRQGLKEFSNWPTFPQLYIKGEFVGGCDIVLEMHQNGELKQVLAEKELLPQESLDARLKKLIDSSKTMLFMKGTPDEPRCGFSNKVVTALREESVEFGSFDILGDEEVRQGLKTFSNWPTYPQLYHKGELLGGCDIVLEMKANGELKSSLAE